MTMIGLLILNFAAYYMQPRDRDIWKKFLVGVAFGVGLILYVNSKT